MAELQICGAKRGQQQGQRRGPRKRERRAGAATRAAATARRHWVAVVRITKPPSSSQLATNSPLLCTCARECGRKP